MSESFDSIRAPQFVDFTQELCDEEADVFFDREEVVESGSQTCSESIPKNDEVCSGILPEYNEEEVEPSFRTCGDNDEGFFSPIGSASGKPKKGIAGTEGSNSEHDEEEVPIRRSISCGNLLVGLHKEVASLCKEIDVIDLTDENDEEKHNKPPLKILDNNMSKSMCSFENKQRFRENLNRLAQPKRHYSSVENLNQPDKFISMAELVKCFQHKTPTRFRTKPKFFGDHLKPLQKTSPHSPALLTKLRSRPQHVLSHEEREQLEYKKEQKFRIKAHPVNHKVLQGPLKPTVPLQKQITKPEPFALTVISKKAVPPSPKKPQFHAKPAPRITPVKVKQPAKKPTIPQTPTFMKRYEKPKVQLKTNETSKRVVAPSKIPRSHKTCPEPFSFEQRNKEILKKKEELLKKVVEQEKKAREFHANPVPKYVSKKNASTDSVNSVGSAGSSKHNHKSEENLSTHFKARPATVLYKEPFIPAKAPKPLTEINDFQLHTELRAEERDRFEQQLKEKEELMRLFQEEEERQRLQKEAEEVARLRKEAEHKAQPVKKYKELIIQPSGKVTQPISPKFLSGKHGKNKENNCSNAS